MDRLQEGRLCENWCRFYVGEISVGLSFLHSQGFVYRDLKPENVMLDASGHIHLVDYGLCIRKSQRRWSNGGTTEYIAPEVLSVGRYGECVDWWELGILTWELLTGSPPFRGQTKREVYTKILSTLLVKPDFMSISISCILLFLPLSKPLTFVIVYLTVLLQVV